MTGLSAKTGALRDGGTSNLMYELIFEGTEDNTPDTLRRVKGAFISDLNFSVEEVKNILDNAPLMILRAKSENELHSLYVTLQKAGGKVAIVKPAGDDSDDHESADGFEFSIEFDEDSEETTILEPSKPPKDPPVYALDFNPDEELPDQSDDIIKELGEDGEISTPVEELSLKVDKEVFETTEVTAPEDTRAGLDLNDEADEDNFEVDSVSSDELDFDLQALDQSASGRESNIKEEPELEATTLSDDEGLEFKLTFDDSLESDQSESDSFKVDMEDTPSLSADEEAEDPEESGALSFIIDDSPPEQAEQIEPTPTEVTPPANDLESSSNVGHEEILDAVIDSAFTGDLNLDTDEPALDPAPEEKLEASQAAAVESQHSKGSRPKEGEETEARSPLKSNKAISRPEPPSIASKSKPKSSEQSPKEEVSKETRNFSTLGAAGLVLVLILVIGNTFLLYENLFGNRGMTGVHEETIESIMSSLAKSSEPAHTIASKKNQTEKVPTLQFKDLRDSSTTNNITVNWDLTTRGTQIISGNIQVATPRPPALTPEEIVRNVQPHPWLRRAELLALRFVPTEDGSYRATTLARSYIEQGASRHRAVARAEVVASFNPKNDTLEGEISLFLDYDEDQLKEPLKIQSLLPGSFQLGLKTTFGNAPLIPTETPESP